MVNRPETSATLSSEPSEAEDFDLIIEAGATEGLYWRDVWRYRGLLFFLSWRDVLVQYKQTVIGIAWAGIRPLVTMTIFSLVFGRIAHLPSEGVPYPVMVFAAMLPWQLFASGLLDTSNSLISNSALISKIYFPRIVVPLSSMATPLIDFAISLLLLLALMVGYGTPFTWRLLLLPLFAVVGLVLALGAGIWFCAFNVKYRDFRYVVPFIAQLGLYVSPVGFASSIVPARWQLAYAVNPMVGVIDGFRWAVSGGVMPFRPLTLAIAASVSLGLFISGCVHFRTVERTFADVI